MSSPQKSACVMDPTRDQGPTDKVQVEKSTTRPLVLGEIQIGSGAVRHDIQGPSGEFGPSQKAVGVKALPTCSWSSRLLVGIQYSTQLLLVPQCPHCGVPKTTMRRKSGLVPGSHLALLPINLETYLCGEAFAARALGARHSFLPCFLGHLAPRAGQAYQSRRPEICT